MAIIVQCPRCNQQGEVSRSAADKDVNCAACKQTFRVPIGAGHLTIEWGVGVTGHRVLLTPPNEVRIGRATDCELGLPGARVSRHHAAIRWENGDWHLHDLGSANGTLIDGRPIKDAVLTDGTQFVVGDFSIRVALARKPRTDASKALDALATQESVYGGPSTTVQPIAPTLSPSRVFGPRDPLADTTYSANGLPPAPTLDASEKIQRLEPPVQPVVMLPQRKRWPFIVMGIMFVVVFLAIWWMVR